MEINDIIIEGIYDPRDEEEQLQDSISLALEPEIQAFCPVDVGNRKNMEKLVNSPEFGFEKHCEGCKWHLKDAPQFLNCAVLVFGGKNNYEYSVKEISEMTGESKHVIEGIINSGKQRFIKEANDKQPFWKKLQSKFKDLPD